MRIAYLTQPYPPMVSGASIVAEQLAKAMAARGHQVFVIAASETGKPYTERTQNLTVLRLNSIRNPLRVNQRIMFMQRRAVLQALYRFKPEVIHVHEPLQMGLVGLRYAKGTNIPITMTSHQLPWFVAPYMPNIPGLRVWTEKQVWKVARWLAAQYTIVISPTKTISNIIRQNTGITPKTINYGIELKTFNAKHCKGETISVRTKFNIPADAPIILHAGRLDADKHADRVILASANAIKTLGAHLFLAGDGCEKSALLKLCRSLGIESQVHFPGFISNKQELAAVYRSSDLFVTASEIETQGIVILEALACGLPVVAVRAACIPEIVRDGINGRLVESGDICTMAKAIETILQSHIIAHSMKIHSLALAKKYDIQVSFTKHEELYLQIAKSNHKTVRGTSVQGFRKYLIRPNK
jgi:1,2-diacylglycerol 3-alpha-glucosyltransferase